MPALAGERLAAKNKLFIVQTVRLLGPRMERVDDLEEPLELYPVPAALCKDYY